MPVEHGLTIYCELNHAERGFNKLEHFRHVAATRFDCCDVYFLGFLHLALAALNVDLI